MLALIRQRDMLEVRMRIIVYLLSDNWKIDGSESSPAAVIIYYRTL
ncbi:MAG: hypothetical protein ABFD49_05160 [Armatimonadota bacterium]|nr:hypothetical protein [bacterium]